MPRTVLVIYSSRTGFTQRYAEWIAEELDGTCISIKEYKKHPAKHYDLLLCGGGVYGNEIADIRWFKKTISKNIAAQVLFFATGIRPATPKTVRILKNYNFAGELAPSLCYFQGGLALDKLKPRQRAMLSLFRRMLSQRKEPSEADLEVLQLLHASGDYTDRTQVIAFIKKVIED